MKIAFFFAILNALLLPLASAVDFRVLVKFNPKQYHSGDAFCKAWVAAWFVTPNIYLPHSTPTLERSDQNLHLYFCLTAALINPQILLSSTSALFAAQETTKENIKIQKHW